MNADFLNRFQGLVTEVNVPKKTYNNFGGYYSRSLEDIFEGIKDLTKKHGILITVSDTLEEIGGEVYVKATATAIDAKGDKSLSSVAYAKTEKEKKKFDACQLTGMASSYARKYALGGLLCLDDVKDSDTRKPEVKPESELKQAFEMRKSGGKWYAKQNGNIYIVPDTAVKGLSMLHKDGIAIPEDELKGFKKLEVGNRNGK